MSDRAPAVERWLAWRYLATRQREGFVSFIAMFSLIGVALGVGTLIAVLSVMGGFREQLLGRIIGMNGHVVIAARGGLLQATPELLARLKDVPGVEAVRLTLERQVLAGIGGGCQQPLGALATPQADGSLQLQVAYAPEGELRRAEARGTDDRELLAQVLKGIGLA